MSAGRSRNVGWQASPCVAAFRSQAPLRDHGFCVIGEGRMMRPQPKRVSSLVSWLV